MSQGWTSTGLQPALCVPRPLPDGKTDKAELVLAFSETLFAGVGCRLGAAISAGLLIVLAVDALSSPNWREHHRVFDNIYVGSEMDP